MTLAAFLASPRHAMGALLRLGVYLDPWVGTTTKGDLDRLYLDPALLGKLLVPGVTHPSPRPLYLGEEDGVVDGRSDEEES